MILLDCVIDLCAHISDVSKNYGGGMELHLPSGLYYRLREQMGSRAIFDDSGQYSVMKIDGVTIKRKRDDNQH